MTTQQIARTADLNTIRAMRAFGGSFVQCLGEAATHADPANLAKIKATWPEYWDKYRTMTKPQRPMKPQIELGTPSEPIKGAWRWYSCEYSLDGGETWHEGEVQSDGHMMAEETLVDEDGNEIAKTEDNL